MNRDAAIEAAVKAIEALRFTATAEDFATAVIDAATPYLLEELTQRHHLVEQFLRGSQACSCGKDRFCSDLRILSGLLETEKP